MLAHLLFCRGLLVLEFTLSVIEGKGYSFFITLVHFIIVGRILRLRLLNSFMWKIVLALSRVRMSGLAELILILFIDNEKLLHSIDLCRMVIWNLNKRSLLSHLPAMYMTVSLMVIDT